MGQGVAEGVESETAATAATAAAALHWSSCSLLQGPSTDMTVQFHVLDVESRPTS